MSDHCKDCKYWRESAKYPGDGECGAILDLQNSVSDDPPAYILAHGWEVSGAELMTKADFGCVQWEAK